MDALVTGGAGFIGSALAAALIDEGWSVRVLDNLSSGFESNIPSAATFLRGDLRELEEVREACRGVDVVFHQGAVRSVPRSVDDPFLTEWANVIGTLNVLVAAQESGVGRVVYASSSSVYGDNIADRNREDMKPEPASPYAVSKLAGEHYCGVWTKVHGLPTFSLRYFNVFGPGQRPDSKYSTVFPAFIQALSEGRAPEIHSDGEQLRDFTFIDDVVRANLRAASAPQSASGRAFNIGAGNARSVNQVLASVSSAAGVWLDPTFAPKRAGDVTRTFADIGLARTLLGWEPQAPWESSVEATVRWFKEARSEQGMTTSG